MEEKKHKKISIGWALLFLLIGGAITAIIAVSAFVVFFISSRSGGEVLAMFQAPTATATVTPTLTPTAIKELSDNAASNLVRRYINYAVFNPEFELPEDSPLRDCYEDIIIGFDKSKLKYTITTEFEPSSKFDDLAQTLIFIGSWVSLENNLGTTEIRVSQVKPNNIHGDYYVTGQNVISDIANLSTIIADVVSFEYDCGGDLCCEDIMNGVPESESRCNNNQAQAQSTEGVSPHVAQNCTLWSDVTLDDVGKEMCVYGAVKNTRIDDNGTLYLSFGSKLDDFYFVHYGSGGYWEGAENDCRMSTGKIEQLGSAPVMVVDMDEMYDCE